MDAPIEIIKQMEAFLEAGEALLNAGKYEDALAKAEAVKALDPFNLKGWKLQIKALEAAGQEDALKRTQTEMEAVRKEIWQRQVEAEIRSRHETMGEAIRHETL